MKEFNIKVVVDDDDRINTTATNIGFNAMELLGILEMKKMDIIDQCINPEKFKTTRKLKMDGEEYEIVKDGE